MPDTTTTDALAAIGEQLSALHYSAPRPTWDALAERMKGRTWTAPRGVTFTTDDRNGAAYVETKHASFWSGETHEDRRSQTNVTIYGTLSRAGKETRGSVDIWHGAHHEDGRPLARAYFRHLTGASVPDGARENVAAAVLADVRGFMGADDNPTWITLGDEAEAVAHAAAVSRHISEAFRAVEQAARAITTGKD